MIYKTNEGTVHIMLWQRDLTSYSFAAIRFLYIQLRIKVLWQWLGKGKGHPITGHEGPTGGVEV
jgi:hypothetical protein